MSFALGEQVGEYRIIGVLGSGGMGTVYKVQHQISQRVEALKVLLPNLSASPDLAERFIREIRVQASLNHPNIASLHNALRVNNQLLMVMEYIDGISLYLRLKQGPIPIWHGVNIVCQALAALGYAHSAGVIHRDVKPANFMLTNSGVVKLTDFGIARSSADHTMTHTGSIVGSVHYMPPEQVRGRPADARSDIYSVGVTLYEIVTGLRPFSGESSYEIMNAHVTHDPINPSKIDGKIPPALAATILKALEKDPGQRFQSCAEFATALQDLVTTNFHPNTAPGLTETLYAPVDQAWSGAAQKSEPAERPVTPTPTPTATPARQDVFTDARIEALRRELAQYVGPVARVLVDRAVKRANTWKDVYDVLAPEVPAGKERERFLAARPKP